jgi:hypothetical protein
MTQPALWNQEQLAQHWLVSEGTLERWRCDGIGPVFLKIRGHVRYRVSDIIDFEEQSLRKSTSESVNTSTTWR